MKQILKGLETGQHAVNYQKVSVSSLSLDLTCITQNGHDLLENKLPKLSAASESCEGSSTRDSEPSQTTTETLSIETQSKSSSRSKSTLTDHGFFSEGCGYRRELNVNSALNNGGDCVKNAHHNKDLKKHQRTDSTNSNMRRINVYRKAIRKSRGYGHERLPALNLLEQPKKAKRWVTDTHIDYPFLAKNTVNLPQRVRQMERQKLNEKDGPREQGFNKYAPLTFAQS